MLNLSKKFVLGVAGAALLAAPIAALAAHGKAGLWQITVTINDSNARMPDLSKLPPDVQARMKAMGVSTSGNTISVQHCMTMQEFGMHKLPSLGPRGKDCTMSNASESGGHFSADLTCSGRFSGSGHVQADWDSDDHYTADVSMTGVRNGQPVSDTEKVEGRFLSAQCGAAGQ